MPSFDPFRRFRRRPTPPPLSSSEEDSDGSSHERDHPHILRFVTSKNTHRSTEPLPSGLDNGRRPKTLAQDTHITFALHKARTTERPSKTSSPPTLASDSVDAPQPPAKSSLMRRVTSKFNMSIPSKSNAQLRSRPSTRTLPADMTPRAAISVSPMLPNSFISREHREAALRERGLRPPCKDLSEQEREADQRLGCTHLPITTHSRDGVSEAERLKVNWLAVNRTSESIGSDTSPSSSAFSDMDASRRSGEGGTDLLAVGRPSISSSVHPLSTSSHLEVLHEDPSEHGVTYLAPLSSTNPPIIVSTVLDYPSSPILVESPTSFTWSSRRAGSLLSSRSQPGPPPVPEKENVRSPVSRRRTNDSGDRGRKVARPSSLSNLGTRSLSNLRRSVAGSLWLPSSSTLSSTDLHPTSHPVVQAPRAAISPTIHSLGSISRETRHIEDVESRRLSELAFLD